MSDRKNDLIKDKDHPAAKGAVTGGVVGGVAGGATAGMLVGGVTGPVGAAIGAAVGAAVGAFANRKHDPVVEDAYWRDNYASRPYVTSGAAYDQYQPAYTYGADSYSKYPGKSFDDVEADLGRDWNTARGKSSLDWDNAKHATRDAFHRVSNAVERAVPGDSDGDGR